MFDWLYVALLWGRGIFFALSAIFIVVSIYFFFRICGIYLIRFKNLYVPILQCGLFLTLPVYCQNYSVWHIIHHFSTRINCFIHSFDILSYQMDVSVHCQWYAKKRLEMRKSSFVYELDFPCSAFVISEMMVNFFLRFLYRTHPLRFSALFILLRMNTIQLFSFGAKQKKRWKRTLKLMETRYLDQKLLRLSFVFELYMGIAS